MTITEAQGQTLKVAGLDLTVSYFSHGQLYLALSRLSDPRNLYALMPESKTTNVVYRIVVICSSLNYFIRFHTYNKADEVAGTAMFFFFKQILNRNTNYKKKLYDLTC